MNKDIKHLHHLHHFRNVKQQAKQGSRIKHSNRERLRDVASVRNNLFYYLRRHPNLQSRLITNNRNHVMTNQDLGELNYTHKFLSISGNKITSFRTHSSHNNEEKIRKSLTLLFSGQSTSALHIHFAQVAQLALGLHLPIEALIYGIDNTRLIGLYNAKYYNCFSLLESHYFGANCLVHHHLQKFFVHHFKGFISAQKLADIIGVSRNTIYTIYNKPTRMYRLSTKQQINSALNLIQIPAIKFFQLPIMSKSDLENC